MASAKKVRACIVGMGIGRPNGKAIARNPRGEVVALCDLLEDRMQSFAKELPGEQKLYTDYKKMCKDPEIDAVFVGTPNQMHVPIAFEAVKNDKHVLITKPLADAEKPAARLVEAAEKAGVVNMMSLSTRFRDTCRYLGDLARGGYFGELYYARSRSIRRSGIPAWNMGFIQKGGGAFRDMGVHVLDAAWWVLGMPKPISVIGVAGAKFGPRGLGYGKFKRAAKKVYSQYAADDYGAGLISFEGGVGLEVESFWACHQPNEVAMELFGTEAGARTTPIGGQTNVLHLYRTENEAPHDVSVSLPPGPDAWDNIASHFIECILDGVKCSAPLRHGLIVQQMMEAVLKSADTGREVRIK